MALQPQVSEPESFPYRETSNTEFENHGFVHEGSTTPPLLEMNIGQLLDEQQRGQRPEKTALVSRLQKKVSLTYKELHSSSQNIARSLLAHGVRPRDRVVVLAGNTLEYAQLFFAVGAIGAIFAIINPTFTAEEVIDAVKFLGKLRTLSSSLSSFLVHKTS